MKLVYTYEEAEMEEIVKLLDQAKASLNCESPLKLHGCRVMIDRALRKLLVSEEARDE